MRENVCCLCWLNYLIKVIIDEDQIFLGLLKVFYQCLEVIINNIENNSVVINVIICIDFYIKFIYIRGKIFYMFFVGGFFYSLFDGRKC